MNLKSRPVTALLFACALVLGAGAVVPAAATPPGDPSMHDFALWPRVPRIPIKPPKFPIGEIRMPATPTIELPALADTTKAINMSRLLGKPAVSKEEKIVANAACRAMQAAFLGTGQHGFWENAILANVDEEAFENPLAEWAINVAADRAASVISAAQHGEGVFKLYVDTCYQKRLR